MASSLVVPVVRLAKVRPHPKADRLELCDVLGYQMCVPKGKYKSGDVVVYVPADSLVPLEWAERWGVTGYLHGPKKDRVGRVCLRGEPSFGLVVDMPSDLNANVGDNVADSFGIQKYEQPVKATCGDAAAYDSAIDPFFQKYTDIENGRVFVDVFIEGEEIVATEKIHGTNCKVGFVRVDDDKTSLVKWVAVAGSMEVRRKLPQKPSWKPKTWIGRLWGKVFGIRKVDVDIEDTTALRSNVYWCPFTLPGVRALFARLRGQAKNSFLLYGEVYGPSIQKLNYGVDPREGFQFKAFDICVDGRYLGWEEFSGLCDEFNVPRAPVVFKGGFNMEMVKAFADGNSLIGGAKNIREGVVVRPIEERVDPRVGRAVLKFIGTEYELSKKDGDDCKDV